MSHINLALRWHTLLSTTQLNNWDTTLFFHYTTKIVIFYDLFLKIPFYTIAVKTEAPPQMNPEAPYFKQETVGVFDEFL